MQPNLIGFGSADGLGSSCGCSGMRRSGMAGFGAGPDGLGKDPTESMSFGSAVAMVAPAAIVSGLVVGGVGYFAGGAIGKKLSDRPTWMTGAATGAALGALVLVVSAIRKPK